MARLNVVFLSLLLLWVWSVEGLATCALQTMAVPLQIFYNPNAPLINALVAYKTRFTGVPLLEVSDKLLEKGFFQPEQFWENFSDIAEISRAGAVYQALITKWGNRLDEAFGDHWASAALLAGVVNRPEPKPSESSSLARYSVVVNRAKAARELLAPLPSLADMVNAGHGNRKFSQSEHLRLALLDAAVFRLEQMLSQNPEAAGKVLEERAKAMGAELTSRNITGARYQWQGDKTEIARAKNIGRNQEKPEEWVPQTIWIDKVLKHRENDGVFPFNLNELDDFGSGFTSIRENWAVQTKLEGELGGLAYIPAATTQEMLIDISFVRYIIANLLTLP